MKAEWDMNNPCGVPPPHNSHGIAQKSLIWSGFAHLSTQYLIHIIHFKFKIDVEISKKGTSYPGLLIATMEKVQHLSNLNAAHNYLTTAGFPVKFTHWRKCGVSF